MIIHVLLGANIRPLMKKAGADTSLTRQSPTRRRSRVEKAQEPSFQELQDVDSMLGFQVYQLLLQLRLG